MTTQEFSDSFDTLLNSYNVQAGFGEGANKQGGIALDEYEKSVLLTQAQDIIVKSYFDRTLNQQGQGFDDSARRQVDFSSLIKVAKFKSDDTSHKYLQHDDVKCYDDRGLLVNLGEEKKILFILNERLEVTDDNGKRIYVVVPINYREYDREMSKAYAQPLKKQAWRLFSNNATGYDIDSEIIPIYGSFDEELTETYYEILKDKETNTWEKSDTEPEAPAVLLGTITSISELPDVSKDERQYADNSYYKVIETKTTLGYVVRYVERPTPIVLQTLPNNLKIDGYSGNETKDTDGNALDSKIFTGSSIECSLNPILHMDILNKAYELAVTTRGGGTAQRQQNDNRQQ